MRPRERTSTRSLYSELGTCSIAVEACPVNPPSASGSATPGGNMIAAASARSVTSEDRALAHLRARRSTAFAIGEAKARRREISADAYLFLYKELVGLAGELTSCWPSLEFLVGTLDTSEGTLKRWLKELERADLIRRKPRPGGQTSLTYIKIGR